MFLCFFICKLMFLTSIVGTAKKLHTMLAVGSQRLLRFYSRLLMPPACRNVNNTLRESLCLPPWQACECSWPSSHPPPERQ